MVFARADKTTPLHYITSEYSVTVTSDDDKVPRTPPIFHVWQIDQWTVRVKIEGLIAHL